MFIQSAPNFLTIFLRMFGGKKTKVREDKSNGNIHIEDFSHVQNNEIKMVA